MQKKHKDKKIKNIKKGTIKEWNHDWTISNNK